MRSIKLDIPIYHYFSQKLIKSKPTNCRNQLILKTMPIQHRHILLARAQHRSKGYGSEGLVNLIISVSQKVFVFEEIVSES